ncbi:MAG TPA: protein YgfX, partial [Rudaea sp.]|nr:protein YgfX [Rudaea sp.]
MKSAPAITFDYRPSRRLAAGIAAIALVSLVAVASSGIAGWLRVVAAFAACAYAALALRRFLASPVRRVAWHTAGHWRLLDAAGEEHAVELRHAVVRGAWIVLSLRRNDGRRVALVLAPDNCPADVRRRLRIRLASVRELEPTRS